MERQNTSDSIEVYANYWKKKIQRNKKKLKERKETLIKHAIKCSELLKAEFGVKKVYLIGSLTRGFQIHEHSDIDLVVVGLQARDYFSALNKVYNIIPAGINIDLITAESANLYMKKAIIREGVLL